MPSLVHPALPEGTLRGQVQPQLELGTDAVLRPWGSKDAAMVKSAFDEPDIQLWHMRRVDSLDEAATWTASWAARWAAESDAAWAIARTASNEPVGYAALRTLFLPAAQAQVSYWLVPSARGRGLATRAAAAVAAWGFSALGLQRVSLSHSVVNGPSCRVATAAGFAAEGIMRRYMLHADGWHDMHLHAKVAPAHPARE